MSVVPNTDVLPMEIAEKNVRFAGFVSFADDRAKLYVTLGKLAMVNLIGEHETAIRIDAVGGVERAMEAAVPAEFGVRRSAEEKGSVKAVIKFSVEISPDSKISFQPGNDTRSHWPMPSSSIDSDALDDESCWNSDEFHEDCANGRVVEFTTKYESTTGFDETK